MGDTILSLLKQIENENVLILQELDNIKAMIGGLNEKTY